MIPVPPDPPVLDRVFRAQLKAFVTGLDLSPVPDVRDFRAGALAMIATFAPEALRIATIRLHSRTLVELRSGSNFHADDWFKVPYLAAADANLFGYGKGMGLWARNLSHGTASIREALYAPLGLAIRRMDVFESGFVKAMRLNFEIRHGGNQAGICLLLASRAPESRKREAPRLWRDVAGDPSDLAALDAGARGEPVRNDLMLVDYLDVSLHLAQAIAEASDRPDDATHDAPLLARMIPDFGQRARRHPLFSPTISLV